MCVINSPGRPSSMENPENPANGLAPPGCKVRELTNKERETIVCQLLESLVDERLPYGAIKEMAEIFHVNRLCISKIWNKSVKAQENGNYSLSVIHNRKAGMTNNLKYNPRELGLAIQELPTNQRRNYRDAVQALGVSTTTIKCAMSFGEIVSHFLSAEAEAY